MDFWRRLGALRLVFFIWEVCLGGDCIGLGGGGGEGVVGRVLGRWLILGGRRQCWGDWMDATLRGKLIL